MNITPDRFHLVPKALGVPQLLNILEINLKMWLNWAILKDMGGWFNVNFEPDGDSNTTFPKNSNPQRLRPVSPKTRSSYKVYEGFRKDWVWESGVNYVSIEDGQTYNPYVPVVYVDDVLVNSSNYSVDYPNGRIIFSSALQSSSVVEAKHSFRWVQIHTMSEAHSWFRQLQFGSFNGNSSDFLQADSVGGSWSILGQHRFQMPCVVIESVARGTARGYELGSEALETSQDVIFHVLAEDPYIRNNILDTIRFQQGRNIWLFSPKLVTDASAWPLTDNGEKANSNVYTDLISSSYRWRKCYFSDARLEQAQDIHPNLFEGIVTLTADVIAGQI